MAHSPRIIRIALATLIAVLSLAASGSARAQGSNTTNPAPPPITPNPVITSAPQLTSIGQGGCSQQYTDEINRLIDSGLISQDVGLGLNSAAAVAKVGAHAANIAEAVLDEGAQATEAAAWTTGGALMIAGGATVLGTPAGVVAGGVAMEAVAATTGIELAATTAKIAGLVAETADIGLGVAGVAAEITGQVFATQAQELSKYVATLPNCEAEFTGTVKVSGGGVNVTGVSRFNDDVGVAGDVNAEGDVTASQVRATQGISAVGGGIWIGDPNGTTYSDGITLGGGALSGAGVGGAQAFTGDVDAIAIGNNARAMESGSLALGKDAASNASNAIAIGQEAAANGEQDVVIGTRNSTGAGGNNTVVGNEIDILGAGSSDNTVLGGGHQVTGSENFVGGDPNTIIGSRNVVSALDSNVTGDSNVAIGDAVSITGNRAVAMGNGATTEADDATAIGTNALASAEGSAAYGQGAIADLEQQQVFGTEANTYTTPGITSGLSRSRQTGALEVATADKAGNLATDGGSIFDALSENQAGIAISMALVSPSLATNESFGVALNWGGFQESHALGLSAIGVVARNVFGDRGRISLNGGLGVSVAERSFGGRDTQTQLGGRAGVQLSW